MKLRCPLLVKVLVVISLGLGLNGCGTLMKDMVAGGADAQNRRAMEAGRMSPSEYQQQRDAIDQATR